MYFLWYLLIGLVAGCIAGFIVRGHGAGFFVNIIVGLVGSLLGGWIVSLFGWVPMGTGATLLTAILGAVILLLIVSLCTRRRAVTN